MWNPGSINSEVLVAEFQSRLRSFAFGPDLDRLAEDLLTRLAAYRRRRADIHSRPTLKALSLAAEYLDALGRASEAAALLRLTATELLEDSGGWMTELANAPDADATRRLMRQRVWCAMAFALTQIRTHRLDAAGPVIDRMSEFVERHLVAPGFPCHGTLALIRYYRGLWRRNQGQLNEAAWDFDAAIDHIQARLADKQAKYAAVDAARLQREALYARVSTARVLGFGHGGIALARGRYVEARGWFFAAQQMLAQFGHEMWRHGLEVYRLSTTVLVLDAGVASRPALESNAKRLAALSQWFESRNPRNAFIAEAFSIVASVRLRQATRPAEPWDVAPLQRRMDACLRAAHVDAGPLSATATLRLIECLLRSGQWKKCEAELDRFQRIFGSGEEAGGEFAVLRAELWMRTSRTTPARTLLISLVEQRPANRAHRARAWTLLSICERAAGESVLAERSAAMARESLTHVQDGYTRAWVIEEIEKLRGNPLPAGMMPYQQPEDDGNWCDLDYNLEMARLHVVETVYRRFPGYTIERLAGVMGRGHSWLYAFLGRHRQVTWVNELLSR